MKISRRNFLMMSGTAGVAATLMQSGILKAGEIFYIDKKVIPDKWEKAVCRYCGTGCGMEVGVKNGKIVALRGNKDYPVNKGALCLKGLSLMYVVYSNERAYKPLKRTGDSFTEISWDESLNTAALKIKETVAKHGPDSVALYVGAQLFTEEMFVGNKLFKGLIGTNNVEANARLCMASAATGYMTSFGLDEPSGGYSDIEHADCFFIIGSNLAENHPIIFGRVLDRMANDKNVKLIVADPRFTPTAAHADIWLPFFPGMDIALMNSMFYVLFNEGMADLDFIKKHAKFVEGGKIWGPEKSLSLEEYKTFLEDYKPEKVADKVGVEVDKIYESARAFGNSKNALSLWTMGLNQRKWGTWINNQLHSLHLITGKICRPGSTPLSMTGQPNACGGAREQGMLAHILPGHRKVKNAKQRKEMEKIWEIKEGAISPHPGPHTIEMFDRLDDKIKLIWIVCSNPAQTLPNLNKYLPKLKNAYVIVQDIFPPTQTQPDKFANISAEYADLFLPSAFWIEKGGVFGNTERRSFLTEKSIPTPKGLKSDGEIFIEVAKRMGYGKYFDYPTTESIWNQYREATKGRDVDLSGASYEYFRKKGSAQWPINSYEKGGTSIRYIYPGDRHLEELVDAGKVKAPDDGILFYGFDDGRAKIFKRPQRDPAEVPDKQYPFYLTTGRVVHHWHSGTMTMRVPWLRKMVKHSFIEINIVDANKLGIKNHDKVKITSRRDSIILVAKVVTPQKNKPTGIEERVSIPRPGVVFIPFFDASKLTNLLTLDAVDDLSKEPEYKICAVKIERA